MSLITMFGINAVGKDTIAMEFKKRNPNTFVTSESRLLMYHLGIIKKYEADYPVERGDYKHLENTPQNKILMATNGAYKKTLEEFSKNDRLTILLSHLVFMLHIERGKPIFLDEKDPPFPELSDGLIQIISNPEDILQRKINDNENGVRERYHSTLELIKQHQLLCNKKWEKIIASRPSNTYIIIDNKNIDNAVSDVQKFINRL